MKTYRFEGINLEISAPFLVGCAEGHFWFPTVHPLDDSNIICEVVLSADVAQGEWPASLYLSRDSGNTWAHATDIDSYGHTSFLRAEHELVLMPYETWPLEPGDRRNGSAKGTVIRMTDDGDVSTDRVAMQFLGFPKDISDYHKNELTLMNNGNILKLSDGSLFTTLYGNYAGEEKCSAWCLSSPDGITWTFLSLIASWKDTPGAKEGPDESATVRLTDGRLMCVYRIGSGRDQLFHKSVSADEGQSWSKPEAIAGAWSVQPRLASVGEHSILLAGGRPGLFLWANEDGTGGDWQRISLAAHHNELFDDPAFHFEEEVCSGEGRAKPTQTTSYTGLAAISPDEAILCYDRLANGWDAAPGPWGQKSAAFAVRIRVA